MNFLGNILWLVLGGLLIALIYYFVGLLMCITILCRREDASKYKTLKNTDSQYTSYATLRIY